MKERKELTRVVGHGRDKLLSKRFPDVTVTEDMEVQAGVLGFILGAAVKNLTLAISGAFTAAHAAISAASEGRISIQNLILKVHLRGQEKS